MEDFVTKAVDLIEKQQKKVRERSAQWMVGEQLKDICRAEPMSAELLARDLEIEKMSIVEAEKKIKAFADGHKAGNTSCVPPVEADRILREFYGLPERAAAKEAPRVTDKRQPARGMDLDLEALWE